MEKQNSTNRQKNLDKIINNWTAESHGKSYKKADSKFKSDLCQDTANVFKDISAMVDFHSLSSNIGADEYSETPMLLAAASDKEGNLGEALGVALDKNTGDGSIIKVTAWVGNEIFEQGNISIKGPEAEKFIKNDIDNTLYKANSSISNLEKSLSHLFDTVSCLKPLKLGSRKINISLDMSGYLTESDSLLLTLIIAITNAATNTKKFEFVIFSGNINYDGTLKKVTFINDKAKLIFSKFPDYKFYIPKDNYNEIDIEIQKEFEDQINSFENLDDILSSEKSYQEIEDNNVNLDSIASTQEKQKNMKKNYNLNIYFKIFGALILLGIIFIHYKAGTFFILEDFIMVWFLNSENYNIVKILQISELIIIIFMSILFTTLSITFIINIIIKKDPYAKSNIKKLNNILKINLLVKYIKTNPIYKILFLLTILFFLVNICGFIRDFNHYSKLQRYERTEYLIKFLTNNNLLSCITKNISNNMYKELNRLTKNEEYEKALQIGLKIDPQKTDLFKQSFIELAVILIDKIDDADCARKVIQKYVDYYSFIKKSPNACQELNETMEKARYLILKYSIGGIYKGENIDERLIIKIQQQCD